MQRQVAPCQLAASAVRGVTRRECRKGSDSRRVPCGELAASESRGVTRGE